ncbi:adhesion G protein-coupled receptor A1 [Tamandua tetradactyla]|uniref:adhesion G protein-coupled receptor A1 n=1 Tax=Tamandua tetradactyla TaxID=48850 RepID=UPI004053B216
MLWLGLTASTIYTQVTRRTQPSPGADPLPVSKQPLLRFYLISGGVPFIICGVTAATNIRNYGTEDEGVAYCWMAWEPSLGAFYGPAAFITLLTCAYLLGTYIQLRRHPERRYELRAWTEEQQRLAVPDMGHGPGAGPCPPPTGDLAASLLQNEHSFKAQLRAAAVTLLLFAATWAFGALAVSQGHFLDMVFSCLYGAFCVTLGLFVLIHHCAKRDDVWRCWWACCPSRRDAHPKADANGDTSGHTACLQDSPCPSRPMGFSHPLPGHCKMTSLQAAQGHVRCLSPATPCCAKMHCEQLLTDEPPACPHDAFGLDLPLHTCLQARTKPHYFGQPGVAAEHEYTYHLPSSLDGSRPSSRTDSPASSLEGPAANTRACCARDEPFLLPEGSDASTLQPSAGDAHFEMHRRTQSLPFGGLGQNGPLTGQAQGGMPYSPDVAGNIRTGPWRHETTV